MIGKMVVSNWQPVACPVKCPDKSGRAEISASLRQYSALSTQNSELFNIKLIAFLVKKREFPP